VTRARIFAIALLTCALIASSACSLFTSLDGFSDPPVVDGPADSSSLPPDAAAESPTSSSSSSTSGDVANPSQLGLSCNEDGLVLALPFDEGSGTIVRDCSPTGVQGTFGNVVDSNISFGRRNNGGSLEFSKSGGVVVLPARQIFDFTSSMTVAAFVRSDAQPSGGYIGLPWHYAIGGWEIVIDGQNDRLYTTFLYDNNNEIDTTFPPLVKGKWTHLAVVFETDTRFEIFVDGQSVQKKTNLGGRPNPSASTGTELHLGSVYGGNVAWTGGIDELRIYKRALSPEEVATLASR
jgi:hypothetical protein